MNKAAMIILLALVALFVLNGCLQAPSRGSPPPLHATVDVLGPTTLLTVSVPSGTSQHWRLGQVDAADVTAAGDPFECFITLDDWREDFPAGSFDLLGGNHAVFLNAASRDCVFSIQLRTQPEPKDSP